MDYRPPPRADGGRNACLSERRATGWPIRRKGLTSSAQVLVFFEVVQIVQVLVVQVLVVQVLVVVQILVVFVIVVEGERVIVEILFVLVEPAAQLHSLH